jgi:hypothetical protein
MSKDLHIFTNGVDPFVFKVKKLVVHVHSGAPPAGVGPAAGQPGGGATAGPAGYTPVGPLLGVRVMSAGDEYLLEQVDGWRSDWAEGKVIARTDSYDEPSMSQLDSVLESLSDAQSDDVTAVVIQLDG